MTTKWTENDNIKMDNREDVDQIQVAQDTEKFTIHKSMSIRSSFLDNLLLI